MTDTVELVELAVYAALKLRKAGRNDEEIMARIKAERALHPGDNQALLDALLSWGAETEAAIDAKLGAPPSSPTT